MNDFKSTNQKYVHRGFFDLRIDTLQKQDGHTTEYTLLLTKADAVAVLAQSEDGRYLLLQEYRPPIDKIIIGTPGGRMETGEQPIDAARRELLEETGYTSDEIRYLGSYYPLPAICDQKIYLFFAPKIRKVAEKTLDPFESIDLIFYDQSSLFLKIQEDGAVDGVVANLLLYNHLLAKEKK